MNYAGALIRRATATAAILLASLSLSACGGGAAALFAGGGIGGTGFSTGAIIAFGSVIVNGVEFQTGDNTIRKRLDDSLDNIPGQDNEVFQVGMVVRVHHAAGDNNAVQIVFQNDLEGPVANLDPMARTLAVLGQPVVYENTTNLFVEQGATFDNGATVEVSGLYDGAGLMHATFIKVQLVPKSSFEIKGFISNLNTSLKTFTLGSRPDAGTITVDYGTLPAQDLPAGLANGLFVEVKTASSAGTLVATSVDVESSVEDDVTAAEKISIEGFIANLTGTDPNFTFILNGVTVTTSLATEIRVNLGPNAHVQVEGTVTNGILSAGKISPR